MIDLHYAPTPNELGLPYTVIPVNIRRATRWLAMRGKET